MKRILILGCFSACSLPSMAIVINFDNLAAGEVVTNQYAALATFSSEAGQENRIHPDNLGTSAPNLICTFTIGGTINCVNDTYVDFTNPVSNLMFNAAGVNDAGTVAHVRVFTNGVFNSQVNVIGNATPLTPDMVDLMAFTNVTRIELVDIVDFAGIAWDDFSFDNVPEPGTFVALGIGLVALAASRRRR